MKNKLFVLFGGGVFICAVFLGLSFSSPAEAQTKNSKKKSVTKASPKTTPTAKFPVIIEAVQIDLDGLKAILPTAEKPRPLLLNFWATWCAPCREEFPELVKIDAEFRGKGLDFNLISLDEPEDIKTEVPKFLREMRSTMPVYLLKTNDDEQTIAAIAPDWGGGLPFTVLFDANGKLVYSKMGVIKPAILRAEINKVLATQNPPK